MALLKEKKNMKKIIGILVIVVVAMAVYLVSAQSNTLLIEDFEGRITGGPDGTVDFGSGNGSSVEVIASADLKNSGGQAVKIIYNSVPDGYMWVAKGFDLDASNAAWQVKPEDINWSEFDSISFYMYGSDSKADIAFDIKDSGGEIWRYIVNDNFTGWRQIVINFNTFFVRNDWQPNSADNNGNLDFPLRSFQFEPRGEGEGVIYFDTVELIKGKNG